MLSSKIKKSLAFSSEQCLALAVIDNEMFNQNQTNDINLNWVTLHVCMKSAVWPIQIFLSASF
jgi:hypothetical protein